VYDTAGFTADKAEVTYNYLYTAPVSDTNFWSAKHTGSYTPANNQMGDGVEAPFSSMDAAKGYFPVDASVVKTGAGATYDTKAWFKAVIPACRNEKLRPAKMQAGVFFR